MSGAGAIRRRVLAIAGVGLAGLLIFLPQVAIGRDGERPPVLSRDRDRDRDDDWDDGWDDYNRTLLQMQRERLSSEEERAREAGRARRRDELEKAQQKSAEEHDAYFSAILEDAQAALLAPRGVYYRKPGYTSTEGPGVEARKVEVGGTEYLYDQGLFWLHQGSTYIVVTAPPGAVVDRLPHGAARISSRPAPVWYFFGAFFGEKGGAYEVLKPAAGLAVLYLPEGYTRESVKGLGLYRFGDVYFKPVFIQGVLTYQVVEP